MIMMMNDDDDDDEDTKRLLEATFRGCGLKIL